MKSNNEEKNFLINMWNEVDQLEKIEAQTNARKQVQLQHWQQRLEIVLLGLVVLTAVLLVIMQANIGLAIGSQSALLLLCWWFDFKKNNKGGWRYDSNSRR